MCRRVLVIDDEPLLLRILKSFLEDAGHQVFTAADGETALELVQAYRPDAIVCDLYLPGMDGAEFCRRIRQNPEWQAIQLILQTGGAEYSDYQRADIGVDLYLCKPFSPQRLLTVLGDGPDNEGYCLAK
jgi:two-component system, OmpR family, alkaline phosphatase synthesis response regulator PhoP